MVKKFLFSVLLFSSVISFLFSWDVFAQSIIFPNREVVEIIGSLQEPFAEMLLHASTGGNNDKYSYLTQRETGAIIVVQQAVLKKEINYWFSEFPKEISIKFIKAIVEVAYLIYSEDGSVVFDKIEKMTVDKAKEYAMNELFKREVKTATGEVKYSYESYKGNQQELTFQYVIAYHPIDDKSGKVAVKFYSTKYFEPPDAKGFITSPYPIWKDVAPWFLGDWLEEDKKRDGDGKLEPFIMEITSNVMRNAPPAFGFGTIIYKVDESKASTTINVDFSTPVPELDYSEPSTSEKAQSFISNVKKIIAEKSGEAKKLGKDALEAIKRAAEALRLAILGISFSFPGSLSQIPGAVIPIPSLDIGQDGAQTDVAQQVLDMAEEALRENILIDRLPGPQLDIPVGEEPVSLEMIQEQLDDISERIDSVSRAVRDVLIRSGVDANAIKSVENEIAKAEEASAEIEEIGIAIEEANASNSAPETQTLCPKASGVQPLKNKAVINEIAWMGGVNSANNEWIELKNISGMEMDLSGWQVLDKDSQIKIIFGDGDKIHAGGIYLLERTDDETVPNVKADKIYAGNLNNENEALYLFNKDCQLEDRAEADVNWPAGDNGSKRTMERKFDFNWQTSAAYGGTPGSENSAGYAEYHFTGGGGAANQPESSLAQSTSSSAVILPKILITEIQIGSASGTDDDFIELYNQEAASIDVAGYQLKKKSSSGNEYSVRVFPEGSVISPKNYFVWANSNFAFSADATSGQTLASDNSAALFDKDKNIIDEVSWGSSTNPFLETNSFPSNPGDGRSLGRKWSSSSEIYIDSNNNSGDFEIQTPTKRARNESIIIQEEGQSASSTDALPTTTQSSTSTDEGGEIPSLSVVVNEIAWMGTKSESNDEWLELYNPGDTDIDVNGWKLLKNGEDFIEFSSSSASTTIIQSKGFYLLERKHNQENPDDTISNIPADLIFTGGFSNSGDMLTILDSQGNLADKVDCLKKTDGICKGWFAGRNEKEGDNWIRVSMERVNAAVEGSDPSNWASNNLIARNGKDAVGNNINGTPKAENSVSVKFTRISGSISFDDFDILTLNKSGSPYVAANRIIIPENKTLIIDPGVVIKFQDVSDSGMDIFGVMLAGRTASTGEPAQQPVVFTTIYDKDYAPEISESRDPLRGDWGWLYFRSASSSKLENAVLRYGGKYSNSFSKGTVWAEGGNIEIKNSIIEKNLASGVSLIGSSAIIDNVKFFDIGFREYSEPAAVFIRGQNGDILIINSSFERNVIGILARDQAFPRIENNTFTENSTPISISDSAPIFGNNQAQNNNINGIIINGSVPKDTAWQADLPYVVGNLGVPQDKILTLEPGVVVKLTGAASLNVRGILKTVGGGNQIVFTSISDDEYGGDTNNDGSASEPAAGQWNSIYFYESSVNSELDNAVVRYGGWWDVFWRGPGALGGAVKVENTVITISNSVIENNLYAGVELDYSDSTIRDTIFRNHTAKYNYNTNDSSALLKASSNPNLENVEFENNSVDIFPPNP